MWAALGNEALPAVTRTSSHLNCSNATRSLSRVCGAPRRRRSSLPGASAGQGTRHRPPTCVRLFASSAKTDAVQISGSSGVIASGSKKAGAGEGAAPTRAQLRTLFMHSAVPMVGFGVMDNFVMLSAGDLIDNTLGVKFGLATLTAAACGQVVSDVCGVCFGGTVEAFATKLGLPTPDLSVKQRALKISRLTATSGAAVGVVVGCLLGMGTLLFLDTTQAEREKKQREMDTLFATILDDGHDLVGAAKCSLFFVDEEKGEVWSKVATDNRGEIKTGKMITIPITAGIVGEVVRTKRLRNVADTSKDRNYFEGVDIAMKTTTRNMLAVPVMSRSHGKDQGKVIAVIEMMDKAVPFDENDEKLVGMLAAHMGAFMRQLAEGSGGQKYAEAQPLKPLYTPKPS